MVFNLLEFTRVRSYDPATTQPGDMKPCSSTSITVTITSITVTSPRGIGPAFTTNSH